MGSLAFPLWGTARAEGSPVPAEREKVKGAVLMLNFRRSIGVFWALVGIVSGSFVLGPAAQAGFQPGTGTGLPPTPKSGPCFDASNIICTCAAGTPARLACDDQRAYYAYSDPSEVGPYISMQAALHDALMASYWNQAAELPGEGEWGSMIYKDRYGLYWFTAPIRGVVLPDGSWITMLNAGSIGRPGSTVVASEHTHPKGTYDPTGSGTTNGGDNQSDHPMFVIKGDDTVWYFPPNTERALLYGVIKDGKVQTKYTTGSDNQIDLSQDPYKMAAASNTAGSSDFSWVDFATAVSVVIGTATLITLLAVFGSPSTGGNIPDGSTVVPDPFNTMCSTYPSVCYP